MLKYIKTIILFILFPWALIAQEFKASVNNDVVATGDAFKITFKINDKGTNFQPPNFPENFRVVSGPNHSSSMQIINGNFSVSESYSYIIVPLKEGSYTIPPAKITVEGKIIESNPVTIKVVKGQATTPKPQSNTSNNKSSAGTVNMSNPEDVFIKCYVSNTHPYVGQHIVATFKIYNRLNIIDNNVTEMPSFTGFWSEEIDIQPTTQYEIINGKRYQTAILKKMVLFPQRSGKLTIEPMEMELVARIPERKRSRNFFDQFFGTYVDKKFKIKSPPVTIQVKPLPTPQPADFSGAVGKFSINLDINKTELQANDALNFKFKIRGTGNLKLIEAPDINFPPDFEVYDPKITDHTSVTSAGVSGSKTFDYLVIPRYPGTFVIPPVSFTYFDLNKKQYVTLNTDSVTIKVLPGSGGNTSISTYIPENKNDIKLLGSDIRYIKTKTSPIKRKDDFFITSPIFWILWFLPFVASLLFIPVYHKVKTYYSNTTVLRQKRAGKVAAQHLKKAKKMLQAGNKEDFKEELSKALFGYVAGKLNIDIAELNKDVVRQKLLEHHISEAAVNEFIQLIDEIEMARFAPTASLSDEQLLEKAEKNINELEKHLG